MIVKVLLDPKRDAWEADLCNCDRCCARYVRAYRAAARRIARTWVRSGWLPNGTEIEVVVGHYDGPDAWISQQEPSGLWQAIHDACRWRPLASHKGHERA